MRPHDLPSAERFAHGTRSRYVIGCRCDSCRLANREYAHKRSAAQRGGDWNGLVDAGAARRHMLRLSSAGVGRRTIERLSGVARSVICDVRSGKKTQIRARSSKLILAVSADYTRGPIAGELGYCDPCWKKSRHLCLATQKKHGIAVCDPCAEGREKCDYATGQGWYRGDGTKGYPHDLPDVEKLAKKHPHGNFMRYKSGCRCQRCKEGARDYNERLRQNRILLGPNNLVSTDEVKAYLIRLQDMGIGHKTVAKWTGVGKTTLAEILWYEKKQMRRRAANAVLAFRPTLDTFPKKKLIPARATVRLLRILIDRWGIPKGFVAKDGMGTEIPALQNPALKARASTVKAGTAIKVRDYFAKVEGIRSLWEQTFGPIPARHYVYWKPGCCGTTRRSIELRPFAASYDYNQLPPEVQNVMQITNTLKREMRQQKKKLKEFHDGKKQTGRSEKPPVRATGSAA